MQMAALQVPYFRSGGKKGGSGSQFQVACIKPQIATNAEVLRVSLLMRRPCPMLLVAGLYKDDMYRAVRKQSLLYITEAVCCTCPVPRCPMAQAARASWSSSRPLLPRSWRLPQSVVGSVALVASIV